MNPTQIPPPRPNEITQDLDPMVGRRPSSHAVDSSSGSPLVPDVYRDACRRLAAIAFIYAAAYSIIHVAMYFLTHAGSSSNYSHLVYHLVTAVSVAISLVVAWLARTQRIPFHAFPWATAAFQIAGTVGIMASYLIWPRFSALLLNQAATALGVETTALIQALASTQMDMMGFPGIAWAWVWMLVAPLVIPLPTRAAVGGTLISAGSIVAIPFLAAQGGDVLPELAAWLPGHLTKVAVSTSVVAGIGIVGSRIVYHLTRSLSQARRMGSYHLEEKIGEGGMGEVWRARHRMLARPAAIKLIKPEALGATESAGVALRRFEREAQVIATLTSPHTVNLYDFGVTDEGRFYYVMELLNGVDLRTLVERFGPQSAGRVRRFLIQACHSLADAHRAGVLHRDIKPGNLFACRRGADLDVIKVLDFGLVKDIGRPADVSLTAEGITTGTPAFMPPEMATGAMVDGRADLYALGCVAFWLLTGRLVFQGDTSLAIIAKHVSEPAPAPSTCSELPIPESLDRLILDCLNKKPDERPANAQALGMRLSALEIADDWTEDRALQWWTTHFPEVQS